MYNIEYVEYIHCCWICRTHTLHLVKCPLKMYILLPYCTLPVKLLVTTFKSQDSLLTPHPHPPPRMIYSKTIALW